MDDRKDLVRKNLRSGRRRRALQEEDSGRQNLEGFSGFWARTGKNLSQTILFGVTIVLICFVGQEPPGLRTLGEVAPENVYSDRTFSYLSEVRRKEAEEWIRSSTPREFTRDFVGEENFAKAMVRLREGMLAVVEMPEESQMLALQSLMDELKVKFQVILTDQEARTLLNTVTMDGEDFFSLGNKLLSQLHLTGVVKFPSLDQKFLAESNATAKIKAQMIDFSNRLVLFDRDKNLSTLDDLSIHYPVLADFLVNLATNEERGEKESFESKSLLQLKDIIENADENQSFAAQELRNDFASILGSF